MAASTEPGGLRELRRKQHDFSDQLREIGWYHSFELPGGAKINGYMTLEWQQERWSRFPIPADLTGKRVLDIGAWDGWFSFEAERRGAVVTSLDCQEQPNYLWLHQKLGSKADYRNLDVFELPWVDLGKFDIVFCLGVLYHLRHPLWGLEILCALATDVVIVETYVTDGDTWRDHEGDIPSMEFYEATELNGNMDNWNGPTVGCVLAMCRAAGFARVELIAADRDNCVVACWRKWRPEPAEADREAPELLSAINAQTQGINFSSRRHHDIDCWFRAASPIPPKEELCLEVGGFGARAILGGPDSGVHWAKFALPQGLQPGWNNIRLRFAGSRFSESLRIAVDMPVAPECVAIAGVRDSARWEADTLNLAGGGYLSCWIDGLPENVDRGNLRLWLGYSPMEITFIGEPVEGRRQINAKAPAGSSPGELALCAGCGSVRSEPISIRVV